MPLSVTERRAAVRQFVAERRGRPEDKRLEGPQIRATPPEAQTQTAEWARSGTVHQGEPFETGAMIRRHVLLG